MGDKVQKLYDAMSAKYSMGMDVDSFREGLKDDERRRKVYDAMSAKYNMAMDYDTFSSDLGFGKYEEKTTTNATKVVDMDNVNTGASATEKMANFFKNAEKLGVNSYVSTPSFNDEPPADPKKMREPDDPKAEVTNPFANIGTSVIGNVDTSASLKDVVDNIRYKRQAADVRKQYNDEKVDRFNEKKAGYEDSMKKLNADRLSLDKQANGILDKKKEIEAENDKLGAVFTMLDSDIADYETRKKTGNVTKEETDALNKRISDAYAMRDALSSKVDAFNTELSLYNENLGAYNSQLDVLKKDDDYNSIFEMAELKSEINRIGNEIAKFKQNKKNYERLGDRRFDNDVNAGPVMKSYGDILSELEAKKADLDAKLANNTAWQAMIKDEDAKINDFFYSLDDLGLPKGLTNPEAFGRDRGKSFYGNEMNFNVNGIVPDRDLVIASELASKAKAVIESPNKYTGEESEHDAFWKGAGDRIKDNDFWLMGLETISQAPRIREVLKKVVDEYGNLNIARDAVNADEEDGFNIDDVLTPQEQKLLEAYFMYQNARGLRANDVMGTYTAGQSAADSAMYAIQFALTAGLGSAEIAGKSIEGVTKALQKKFMAKLMNHTAESFIGKAGQLAVREVGTWAIDQFVGNMGMTLTRVAVLPNFEKAIAENCIQSDEDGNLASMGKSVADAFIDTSTDMFFENSGEAFQRLLGNTIKIPARAFGKNIATSEIAGIFRTFGSSPLMKSFSRASFDGPFEIYEEWKSALFNQVTGRDPDALHDFNKSSNLLELGASFAPMTALQFATGGLHTVAYNSRMNKAFKKLAMSENAFNEYLKSFGISEETISAMNDLVRGRRLLNADSLTEEEMDALRKGYTISPRRGAEILASALQRREKIGDASMANVLGDINGFFDDKTYNERNEYFRLAFKYLTDVQTVNAYNGIHLGKIDARKQELNDEMASSVPNGVFSRLRDKGNTKESIVEIATLPDGTEAFITSEYPNSNNEVYGVVRGESKPRLINLGELAEGSVTTMTLDQYLDGLVRAERQVENEKHIAEQVEQTAVSIRDSFESQKEYELPLGENGEPVKVVVVDAKRADGLQIETPDKKVSVIPWEQVATMVSAPKTIEEEAMEQGTALAAEEQADDDMISSLTDAVNVESQDGAFDNLTQGNPFVFGIDEIDKDRKGYAKGHLLVNDNATGETRKVDFWFDYNRVLNGQQMEVLESAPVDTEAPVVDDNAPVVDAYIQATDELLESNPVEFARVANYSPLAEKLIGNWVADLTERIDKLKKAKDKRINEAQETYDDLLKQSAKVKTMAEEARVSSLVDRAKNELDDAKSEDPAISELESKLEKFKEAYDEIVENSHIPSVESVFEGKTTAEVRALAEDGEKSGRSERLRNFWADLKQRIDDAMAMRAVPNEKEGNTGKNKEGARTLNEALAELFKGKGKIKVDKESLKKHGFGDGEIKILTRIGVATAKGGMTLEAVGDRLVEYADELGIGFDKTSPTIGIDTAIPFLNDVAGRTDRGEKRVIANYVDEAYADTTSEENDILLNQFMEGVKDEFGYDTIEEYESHLDEIVKNDILNEEREEVPVAETSVQDEEPVSVEVGAGETSAPASDDIAEDMPDFIAETIEDAVRRGVSESIAIAIEEWRTRLGSLVNFVFSYDEAPDFLKKIIDTDTDTEYTRGIFVRSNGTAYVYLPNIKSSRELSEVVVHEVVSHKGLRMLLGQKAYDKFCENIFDDVMTDKEKKYWLKYAGVNGNKASAADEWLASQAEKGFKPSDKSILDKLIYHLKKALISLGVSIDLDKDDFLQTLFAESLHNLYTEARKEAMGVSAKYGVSIEDAMALQKRGLTMRRGSVVSHEVASQIDENDKHSKQWLFEQNEDEFADISHSRFTIPKWAEHYATLEAAQENVIKALIAWAERASMSDLVSGVTSNARYPYKAPKNGKAKDEIGPLRKNDEFVFTFDMDTSCPRTLQYLAIVNDIQKRIGRPLTQKECVLLIEQMRAYGMSIPCVYCYAENKRQALKQYYTDYIGFRQKVIGAKSVNEALSLMYGQQKGTDKETGQNKATSKDPKIRLSNGAYETFIEWRSLPKGSYNPSIEQLWSDYYNSRCEILALLDGANEMRAISVDDSTDKIAEFVIKRYGLNDKNAIASAKEIIDEWRWDTIEGKEHTDYAQVDPETSSVNEDSLKVWRQMTSYGKSASSAKNVSRYTPYTDELRYISQEDRDFINGMGGLRMHSTNDFRIDYVLDYFQFMADMAAYGMKGHTYTKSDMFVRIFGNSGYKINMSIAAYQDKDGNIIENSDEGMSWETAKELRDAFPDAGVMLMATSDEQIQMALDSDWIDMFIPFHHSGLPKEIWKNMRAWSDYTSKQREAYYSSADMKKILNDKGIEYDKNMSANELADFFNDKMGIIILKDKDGKRIRPHFLPNKTKVDGYTIPGWAISTDDVENAKEYKRLCALYGVKPRFTGVTVTLPDGKIGDITKHPKYIKCIKETSRMEKEQTPIQFNFDQPSEYLGGKTPLDYAFESLEAWVMSENELTGKPVSEINDIYESFKRDTHGVITDFIQNIIIPINEGKDFDYDYLTPEARKNAILSRRAMSEVHSNDGVISMITDGRGVMTYHTKDYDGVDEEIINEADGRVNDNDINDSNIARSVRTKPAPAHTKKAYKLMRLGEKPNEVYSLFIGSNEVFEVGKDVYYDADSPSLDFLKGLDAGTHLVNMTTGESKSWADYAEENVPKNKKEKFPRSKPNNDDIKWANDNGFRFIEIVDKSGNKQGAADAMKKFGDTRSYYNWGINGSKDSENGEGSPSLYALRPGLHFGATCSMHQIGYESVKGSKVKDMRLDNQVWVECLMAADVDYQSEADANPSGDIPTHIPVDGYYEYATNPASKKTKNGDTEEDLTKGNWYVAGSFTPVRILSDWEARQVVDEYNKENNTKVPYDFKRMNDRQFNADTMTLEDSDIARSVVYTDEDGRDGEENGAVGDYAFSRTSSLPVPDHKQSARDILGDRFNEILKDSYASADTTTKETIDSFGGVLDAVVAFIKNGTETDAEQEFFNNVKSSIVDEMSQRFSDYKDSDAMIDLWNEREDKGRTAYEKAQDAVETASLKEIAEMNSNIDSESDSLEGYVTPEMDAEYIDAVNSGDMQKAQEMVDRVAESRGYNYKGFHGTNYIFTVFDKSKLGSRNWLAPSAAMGFFASASRETAETYTGLNSLDQMSVHFSDVARDNMERIKKEYNFEDAKAKDDESRRKFEEQYMASHNYEEEVTNQLALMRDVMLKDDDFKKHFGLSDAEYNEYVENVIGRMEDTFVYDWRSKVEDGQEYDRLNLMNWAYEDTPEHKEFTDIQKQIYDAWEKTEIERLGYKPNVKDLYIKLENPLVHDFNGEGRDAESFAARMAVAKEEGRDGCIFKNVSDGAELDDIYTVFDNTQFKSASAVTYDNEGNVIPLSERFNDKEEDIRFSRRSSTADAPTHISNEQAIRQYEDACMSVRSRMKEILIDKYDVVSKLVDAIVGASGKALSAGEHIIDIAKSASSMFAYEMSDFTKNIFKPMMKLTREITKKTDLKFKDIEEYLAMKTGLERQTVLAVSAALNMIKSDRNKALAREKERYADESKKSIEGVEAEYAERIAKENERFDDELLNSQATLASINKRHNANLKRIETWRTNNLNGARSQSEVDIEHASNVRVIEGNYNAEKSVIESADEAVRMRSTTYAQCRQKDYGAIRSWFARYEDKNGNEITDLSMLQGENFADYNRRLRNSRVIPDQYKDIKVAEAELQRRIDDYERRMGNYTALLWNAIRKSTDSTVQLQYEHHLISLDTKDRLIGNDRMFQYYVPLRGFDDETAEELYDIKSLDNSGNFTPPLLPAKGRSSKADSPFGYIGSMHSSAAVQAFKNDVLMALYNIVANRPEQKLVTIADVYYVKSQRVNKNGKAEWDVVEFVPDPNKTDEENLADRDAWIASMEQMINDGTAKRDVRDIDLHNSAIDPRKIADTKSLIRVRRFGKEISMKVNSNPRAAQILNGDEAVMAREDEMGQGIGRATRFIAQCFTSWAIPFWFTNLERDLVFGMSQVYITGDAKYRRTYVKNLMRTFSVIPIFLSDDHKLSSTNAKLRALGADFEEFAQNGGITGQTVVWNNERWEKEIESWDKEAKRNKVSRGFVNSLRYLMEVGESIEQISRFAAYMTAKEVGKSTEEAIADAKNITLNFNQKGSARPMSWQESGELYYRDGNGYAHRLKDGGNASKLYRAILCAASRYSWARYLYVFYNAAMQGMYKFYENMKTHPFKTGSVVATHIMLGFMSGIINAVIFGSAGDGDDDEKKNIFKKIDGKIKAEDKDYLHTNTYRKHNRFMLRMMKGKPVFFQWSIPQEYAPFYGLGENLAQIYRHNISVGKTVTDFTDAMADLLPVDFVSPVVKRDLSDFETPTIVSPFVENARNLNSFGSPVYYEAPRAKGDLDIQPGYQKATYSTWNWLTWVAKNENRIFGGGADDAAYVNWFGKEKNISMNPAKWQNVIEGIGGTTAATAGDMLATGVDLASGIASAIGSDNGFKLDLNINNMPVVDRLFYDASTRMRDPYTTEQYESFIGTAEAMEKKLNKYGYGEANEDKRETERLKKDIAFLYYKEVLEPMKEDLKDSENDVKSDAAKKDNKLKKYYSEVRDDVRDEFIRRCLEILYMSKKEREELLEKY